ADAGHVVVLGQPEPPVAQPLDVLRQFQRVAEGQRRRAALDDGREIQDREWNHARQDTRSTLPSRRVFAREWRERGRWQRPRPMVSRAVRDGPPPSRTTFSACVLLIGLSTTPLVTRGRYRRRRNARFAVAHRDGA